MLRLPRSYLQTSSDRSMRFLNMRFPSGGGISWGFQSMSQKYMGKEHQPIYSPDSANCTTCLWCHQKGSSLQAGWIVFLFLRTKSREVSSQSYPETRLKMTTLENTRKTPKEHCRSGVRSCGCCIARIYPTSCLPRDCIVLTWLYFSSPRENLTVHRYSLPFSLHLVYKYSVPKATCSSTAPKEKKTQLGFERSWKLPWLHSKMVL